MAASAVRHPVGRRVWSEKVMTSDYAKSASPLTERLKMVFPTPIQKPLGTPEHRTTWRYCRGNVQRKIRDKIVRVLEEGEYLSVVRLISNLSQARKFLVSR
jgi:hypothetical protein